MATHRVSILGNATPDTSGKVWQEPYSILATNDNWNFNIWRIDEDGNNNAQLSTRAGLYGTFMVPQNYSSSANLVIVWTSSVTSGNAEWDFDYRAISGNDTESLDQATAQESVNSADAAPSAAHERNVLTITLTDGNFAAGDTVEFFLANDGSDAGDTLAGARILVGAYFEYSD